MAFWNKLTRWITNILDLTFDFTVCEIIFGIPNINNQNEIDIINFLILYGKWYINKIKTEGKPMYFINFIELIKNRIIIIDNANTIQLRVNKTWLNMLKDMI